MNVDELLSFKPTPMTPKRENSAMVDHGSRKRQRLPPSIKEDSSILKKTNAAPKVPVPHPVVEIPDPGLEISEEERMKILQMVEDEPEAALLDESSLKRMVNVLEKRIAKNQEMRIKFPDQPEKFMESEVELHESIQELHALPTIPELYPLAVDLSLPSILLGLLAHENADVSCAILDLLQEVTEVDTLQEDEEVTNVFIDNFLDQQAISLLTQNLDRLDEANKDESDGVHNTLAIFENLFEFRQSLCKVAGQHGVLVWLLKRIRARMPFDGNKLYAAEVLAILLQDTQENRGLLGESDGIDVLLQQLAAYKRHDPTSTEEAEFMENLFNCLCSALLWGPNRDRFLKGEGPQLMNLMLREKKQSRSGSLKVLNHAISGPEGTTNANKVVDILGLRTIFPLFMKTPKRAKRKGLSALEHEEHVISIIAGLLQHVLGPTRSRVLTKFEENDFEKIERLGELHFKYLEKVNMTDQLILHEMKAGNTLEEDEIYLKRLESGLFTLQLVDYIIVEACVANPKVKERLIKIIQLRRGSVSTVKEILREYGNNLGEENKEWTQNLQQHITELLEEF